MSSPVLTEIEQRIDSLSLDEQMRLLEHLAQRIRQARQDNPAPAADELAEMAADPDIQRELREIDEEFRVTEMDGLEDER
jgi:hypothetical protein